MNCVDCESMEVHQYQEWSCRRKWKYAGWMWRRYCFRQVCKNYTEVKSESGAAMTVTGPWALSMLPFAETNCFLYVNTLNHSQPSFQISCSIRKFTLSTAFHGNQSWGFWVVRVAVLDWHLRSSVMLRGVDRRLTKFRNSLSVPLEDGPSVTLKMRAVRCTETSVNSKSTPCNTPEEGRPHLHGGRNLKSSSYWCTTFRMDVAGSSSRDE